VPIGENVLSGGGDNASGVAFLVGAEIVYTAIAANCSSPQTTEINASTRAGTLMKWVLLGLAQGAFFTVAAALYDRKHAKPILAGGALAGGVMYASYLHGASKGLASSAPPTEAPMPPGP
jgi:hypothetical protein